MYKAKLSACQLNKTFKGPSVYPPVKSMILYKRTEKNWVMVARPVCPPPPFCWIEVGAPTPRRLRLRCLWRLPIPWDFRSSGRMPTWTAEWRWPSWPDWAGWRRGKGRSWRKPSTIKQLCVQFGDTKLLSCCLCEPTSNWVPDSNPEYRTYGHIDNRINVDIRIKLSRGENLTETQFLSYYFCIL